ncbi:hypothetical protein LN047_02160 [Achromobacter sp. JD417]|uniref:hypothetical protein n=1 Tax=Achromobacter sp. JD417 TaxID=2893881 RepID=UPI0035A614EC
MKQLLIASLIALCSVTANASEFCLDRFEGNIRKANGELADVLKRIATLQDDILKVRAAKDAASKEMVDIVKRDPGLKDPANRERLQALSAQFDDLDRKETTAKNEGFELQDRATALRTTVPADLAGELRGCAEAVAPVNTGVNLVIQTIAILSTGGASLLLPPKALYVDMGQVLHGYPLGGPESAVVKGRQAVMDFFGIGGENNDIGKIVKDPGRVIRCWFGC